MRRGKEEDETWGESQRTKKGKKGQTFACSILRAGLSKTVPGINLGGAESVARPRAKRTKGITIAGRKKVATLGTLDSSAYIKRRGVLKEPLQAEPLIWLPRSRNNEARVRHPGGSTPTNQTSCRSSRGGGLPPRERKIFQRPVILHLRVYTQVVEKPWPANQKRVT